MRWLEEMVDPRGNANPATRIRRIIEKMEQTYTQHRSDGTAKEEKEWRRLCLFVNAERQ